MLAQQSWRALRPQAGAEGHAVRSCGISPQQAAAPWGARRRLASGPARCAPQTPAPTATVVESQEGAAVGFLGDASPATLAPAPKKARDQLKCAETPGPRARSAAAGRPRRWPALQCGDL
jgi:hypothetical protein